ncbi:MAG: ATP synthase F0 subunit B [Bdellovibrionota bacterium]
MTPELFLQAGLSAATFIVLWIVLGNMVFKPLFQLIEEREARTSGDEQAAVERRQEAKDLAATIEEKLRAARVDGVQLRDARVAQAKREAQAILDRAEESATEELRRAQQMIDDLKARALGELQPEAEKLSQLVVARAIAQNATDTIH